MIKLIKAAGLITAIGIVAFSSYMCGARKADTEKEIQIMTIVKEVIPDGYIPCDECIVDMDTVIDFVATEDGVQLYFEDGTGFWLER